MTQNKLILETLVPLISDLARDISKEERYRRLLEALSLLIPCDAIALLQLDQEALTPLATKGLSLDCLGRRFALNVHPRLEILIHAQQAVLFDADCDLPDPYDGLIEHIDGHLPVHDCMGCVLRVDEKIWGLLTLDALKTGQFSDTELQILEAFSGVAAATVKVANRIDYLNASVLNERQKAELYRLASYSHRTLLGDSKVWKSVMKEIGLVAPSDLNVLIIGETGVGKELVAQSLYAQSTRNQHVMVSVNCAALPENLVESELFGHVKGAFSGAFNERKGKFELANTGTIFLDEIGELPLNIQAKLLRVLQNGQIQRIGDDRERHVDVRVIAATNRDLAQEVKKGNFRADLYHRLCAYPLVVPPLREREKDILLLAGTFLEENRKRLSLRGLRLSGEVKEALLTYHWPGNVRELEHIIGRSALKALGRGDNKATTSQILTIQLSDIDLQSDLTQASAEINNDIDMNQNTQGKTLGLRDALDLFQTQKIRESLLKHQGKLHLVAQDLDIDRSNLSRLMKRLAISK